MGTKTGGHWRPCNVGSVEAHNERQQEYLDSVKNSGRNLYFFQHLTQNNSSWVNESERYQGKTVEEIQEEQKKLYEEKFGQKPQMADKKRLNKKTGRESKVSGWSPIREMCPPIKADTKIEDFDYFLKWAENHRLHILRIDLHKDEGYYDEETGENKMNYHAHVVGDFLDWDTGKTIKLGKEVMSEMQTILAISLGMERGERKGPDSPKALTHQEYRQMMEIVDEMRTELKVLTGKKKEQQYTLNQIQAEVKKAETKLKSFTSMLNNLMEQKEHLEIEITALEDMRDTRNKEVEKQLKEKQEQLDSIIEKISLRKGQLNDVTEELKKLDELKDQTKQTIRNMTADAIERHDRTNEQLKEATRAIQEKRKELTKMDKSGELEKARRHVEERDAVLYRRWPEARDAVKSIFDFASSPSAHDFTPQQALHVEHAIVTSGTSRTDAANELLSLARKDFDNSRTYGGWVDGAARVVQSIANNTHRRLTALLKIQPKDAGGSPSYITDLTDWAGNQIKW